MNLIEKIANRFGFYAKSTWDQIWLRGQESMFGGQSVREPYKDHQTVYMAIEAIASGMAQVNFKMFKGQDGPEIKDTELTRLFDAPNPLMSRFQLWEATLIYLAMRGRCIWVFGNGLGNELGTRKLPSEIWVFDPARFKPVKDSSGRLSGWRYESGKSNVVFGVNEVIYFRKFNPFDPIMGFSPLDPIMKTINLDYKALLYNAAFFDNSAEPGGFLSTDQKLTDAQYSRLVKEFESRHKGASNARRVALLEGGLKYQQGALSQKDMEFLEQRRYNREEILGIWRVPKSMFSITDDLNYATAREQKKIFWENVIIPYQIYISEVLNGHFFPRYEPGVVGQFDNSGVPALQEDFHKKVETAERLQKLLFTANEINERLDLGFDPAPHRDIAYIPFGMVPVEQVLNPETEPAAGDTEEERDEKFKRLGQLLTKAIGPTKEAARRKDAWDRFDRRTAPLEKRLAGKVKRYFFELRSEVLREAAKQFDEAGMKAAGKGPGDVSNIPWDKWDDKLKKLTVPTLFESALAGVEIAKKTLEGAPLVDFDRLDPRIVAFLKEKEIKITRINETIRRSIREEISESLTIGETTLQLQDRLKDTFNFASSRSLTIARTEVIGSSNGGQQIYYEEAGVKKKEWITARDSEVRESHQAIDGETVDIDKNFSNGLDHPGGDGPAEEVINCRCTIVPVIGN